MVIDSFSRDFGFLSNFFNSPMRIKGKIWPTVEHLFQACKTKDESVREKIRLCSTAGRAKRMGRKIKLRDDWEEIKEEVMLWCLRLKFRDPQLAKKLLETGDNILIEGNNWHDNFWGLCFCDKCKPHGGKNMLGKLLMKVRKEIG